MIVLVGFHVGGDAPLTDPYDAPRQPLRTILPPQENRQIVLRLLVVRRQGQHFPQCLLAGVPVTTFLKQDLAQEYPRSERIRLAPFTAWR